MTQPYEKPDGQRGAEQAQGGSEPGTGKQGAKESGSDKYPGEGQQSMETDQRPPVRGGDARP